MVLDCSRNCQDFEKLGIGHSNYGQRQVSDCQIIICRCDTAWRLPALLIFRCALWRDALKPVTGWVAANV